MEPITSPLAALTELRAAAARAASHLQDGFVVGTVGHDVPVEIVEASGAVPLRLRGDATWDTAPADHYLGQGLDPAIRSILAGILSGAFGRLDAIVVSSDCDASQRLYYVLREMRRVEPRAGIPRVHLVDILHLPRESTSRYNRIRVTEFAEVLEGWTGRRAGQVELERAIAEHDGRRGLQRGVMSLRTAVPARLSGVDALAVFAAADRMPHDRYDECLRALVAGEGQLDSHEGTRIYLTGSTHDGDSVYRAIECAGAVIVGEDHDRGALLAERDVAAEPRGGDVLDAIARRYQYNGPTAQRASISERAAHTAAGIRASSAQVLLSYIRVRDEAPLWDFAAQRAAVAVPAGVVRRQGHGQIDREALERALTTPNETGVNE